MECIKCGCTDENCGQCVAAQGYPCHWVATNKCSRCYDEDGKERPVSNVRRLQVIKMIEEQLDVEISDFNSRIHNDLGADSLDTVELAMELEAEFDIQIPNEEVNSWRTPNDVAATVEKLAGLGKS